MFFRVKGVSDNFFEMPYWRGVQKKIESHLELHNFSEISTPILEHVSLFQRGLGLETEVVSKQMFIIAPKNQDEKDPICLRPEGTAGTMRAFVEQQHHIPTPFKTYFCGPMFRYERPQKGRLRQFHQVNIECIGASSIMYDIALIQMLHSLFAEIFEMQFVLKINYLGDAHDREVYTMHLQTFLKQHQSRLCDFCKTRLETNVLRILDCKSTSCQDVISESPKLFEYLSETSKSEWLTIHNTLQDLSVNFIHDQTLVRGLDYYNKTVFEFTSSHLGAQSTFCGGGRYDGLAQQLGSKQEVPALGCGIGMERLLIILEDKQEQLSDHTAPLTCIIPVSIEQNNLALFLADNLWSHQKRTEIMFDGNTIKSKIKRAHQLKAQYVIFIGEEEQQNNTVTLKNMVSGEEQKILQTETYLYIA